MVKKCNYCGKEFETLDKRKKFCNRSCYNGYNKENRSKYNSKLKLSCAMCNEEFFRFPSQVSTINFCSRKCSLDFAKKDSVKYNCEICGTEKKMSRSDFEKSKHHYCSYKCSRRGFSKNYKGENSPFYEGVTLKCMQCSQDYVVKKSTIGRRKLNFCSKKCKNKWQSDNVVGKKHPNYNSEMSEFDRQTRREYTEYWKWRKSVYERDSYTCQCCGDSKGGNLVAHHYKNYSEHKELRTEINNGVTLCNKCHRKFHNVYGNKNNNKEQFDEFVSKEQYVNTEVM